MGEYEYDYYSDPDRYENPYAGIYILIAAGVILGLNYYLGWTLEQTIRYMLELPFMVMAWL